MITTADTADQVLADVRALQATEAAAAAALLDRVTTWADLHPPESAEWAATISHRGDDLGLPLAGPGTPAVDTRCVAELGAALGWSTEAAQTYLGQALELRHRLPRLWAAVHTGTVRAWAARRIADHTITLTRETADFVDRQVAVTAGRISTTRLNRLIQAAIDQHMPNEAEHRRRVAADHRCFDIDHHPTTTGHTTIHGVLDLADALDLETAISDHARALAHLGSTETLNARRSRAAGDLARHQPTLDLLPTDPATQPATQPVTEPATQPVTAAADADADNDAPVIRRNRPPRQVVLYLHLSDHALTGNATLGRMQNTATPVLAEQIRRWCSQPDTQITVKPVIDLNQTVSVHAYEVPDRIREHVMLRDLTCVFPWCDHTRVDCDHIIPYARGGPTSTDNLAPLCRRHHRLKTHTGWGYLSPEPGRYEWTSPHGLRFLRDTTGTRELTPHPSTSPDPPPTHRSAGA